MDLFEGGCTTHLSFCFREFRNEYNEEVIDMLTIFKKWIYKSMIKSHYKRSAKAQTKAFESVKDGKRYRLLASSAKHCDKAADLQLKLLELTT